MKFKKLRSGAAIVALLAGMIPSSAMAGGIPTIDTASIAELLTIIDQNAKTYGVESEQLTNAIGQLEKLQEQVETARSQLREAERTYAAVTGARDTVMKLFDGDITARKLANSLGELSMTGRMLNSRVQGRVEALGEQYNVMSGLDLYEVETEDWQTRQHDELTSNALTEIATAEENFSEAGAAMDRYDSYREEIGAAADMKASIDLNTRVQIENGQMLAVILQNLAITARAEAAKTNISLRAREEAKRFAGTPTVMDN